MGILKIRLMSSWLKALPNISVFHFPSELMKEASLAFLNSSLVIIGLKVQALGSQGSFDTIIEAPFPTLYLDLDFNKSLPHNKLFQR